LDFFFRDLEICQLKNDIEANFTTVEQAILELPVSLDMLIVLNRECLYLVN
jgi:hypothetical protein